MIQKLEGFLTQDQINVIYERIMTQMRDYKADIQLPIERRIAERYQRPEYSSHKKAVNLQWALQSAFQKDEEIAGLKVCCPRDGGRYAHVELSDGRIVIHIVLSRSSLRTKFIHYYYKMNKSWSENQRFCYFSCSLNTNTNDITSIDLCVPDINGDVAAEDKENLYSRPNLMKVGA